jgi:putative hydrolase of the HAD superfamily
MPCLELDFSRVRAVTFDAGGTLLTPDPGVGEVYAEILARFDVALAPALLNRRFRAAFKELTTARPRPVVNEDTERAFWREVVRRCISPECPENLVAKVFAELWEEFADARCWRALPGVEEALGALSARKHLRLAVLSNWDSRLHRVLAGFGWARPFERAFISSEIGAEKPDARAFRAVEAALGLPASACLHVGDSVAHDYHAAQLAGWQAILVNPSLPTGNSVLHQISSLAQLPALLPKS